MMKTSVRLLIPLLISAVLKADADFDACTSKPCQNGGYCSDMINDYVCACMPGYSGKPCQNDGVCSDMIITYFCDCMPGYSGGNCETEISEYGNSPCQNGGHCSCPQGFTGTHCETDMNACDSSPCQNGAHCCSGVNSYTCFCKQGYTGTHCETDELDFIRTRAQMVDHVCRKLKWHDMCSMFLNQSANTDFPTVTLKPEMKKYNGCAGVRLSESRDYQENELILPDRGFLEVCRNNEWWPVCWDHADTAMKNVVCRQLGHTYAYTSFKYADNERKRRMIKEEFICTGNEKELDQCKKINHDKLDFCDPSESQSRIQCI